LAGVEGASGHVEVAGEALSTLGPNRRSRLIGFLPASRELVWPIAVRDLVTLGLFGHNAGEVEDALTKFELVDLAERNVDRLSTGERSRVLLARMFAANPRLMLLDEPLANLDPYWVRKVIEYLRERKGEATSATLASLHDLGQLKHFDRVIAVHGGSIAFDGRPTQFLESEEFTRVFRVNAEELELTLS
jgi:iron complex transport system ATP-binding protein